LDNRRLLLAALLSMGILFLWQVLFPQPELPRRPPQAAPAAAAPAQQPTESSRPSAARVEPSGGASTGESAPAAAPGAAAETAAEPAAPLAANEEQTAVLENDLLRAEFSNRGAQLVSLRLKSNHELDGSPLELVQHRAATPYPFALLAAGGEPHPLDAALFVVERDDSPAGASVTFRYSGSEGTAEKRFHLRPDGLLDFATSVAGGGDWSLLLGPGLRNAKAEELGSRFNRRAAVWNSAGEVELADAKRGADPRRLPGGSIAWVGLEDTYFLTAAIPESGLAEARIDPVVLVPAGGDGDAFDARRLATAGELSAEEKKLPHDLRIELAAAGEKLVGTSFWGAKQYDRLSSFPFGLEKTVRWGWLGFIARPLLAALQWIHGHLTPNYGWAIVLLTTALKIVLLPLSLAAFKSMRKMQKLNPKMQAVRERYRPKLRDKQGRFNSDMQRQMNEEIMALYRKEGVNPAGGCFPMLVQLPIFFGFYQVLSTAVELWRSPWQFWIHDLTAPDPYWVLPIVMGLSQIAQQRMTPPPPDPVQKRLMQAMPIVFTVFSLGFPSGLVIYWLTNNLLTIAQQGLYNRMRESAEEHEKASAAAASGSRKSRKRS